MFETRKPYKVIGIPNNAIERIREHIREVEDPKVELTLQASCLGTAKITPVSFAPEAPSLRSAPVFPDLSARENLLSKNFSQELRVWRKNRRNFARGRVVWGGLGLETWHYQQHLLLC